MIILIIIHCLICMALIGIVLIQRGRGSGLVESFSGVESMFGTKTPAFLTRTTTILSVLFFLSCLALAVFSIRQSKSLMRNIQSQEASNTTALPKPEPQKPTQESALPAKSPAQETPAQAPLNQETTKSAPQ